MRARRKVRRRLRPGVIGWSVLLLVGAATGCRAQPAAGPAAGVDVQAYHLRLRLDPETRYIAGRVRIDVAHADTVTALHLALAELQVDTVQVEGVPVQAVRDGDRLTVPLPAGRTRSRVEVAYQGVPPVGLYAKRVAGTPVVYTDSWPDRARGWLPSVDHPSDPATFALDLDVPLGYEVVANGREAARDTAGAYLRTAWRLEASAPTYTFAFAVSDFAVTETTLGDTLPVRYYMLAPDSARVALLQRTPASLAFFSERLGPYAFSTYAVVEIPIGFGGMENASVPFLNVELFTDPEGQAESVQVHEAAHQWFGNRVVIRDWQHLWLSEGVATYLTTWFYEQTDGLDAARTRWVDLAEFGPIRRRTHGPLVPAGPVDPNRFLTWVPYQKGASVLHVLRLRLGDEPFFAAVRRLYQAFAGQPLSTEQFQQTLEAESGEDLDALFEYWVYGDAVPTLQATWDAGTRTLRWRVDGDAGTLDGVPVELQLRQGAYTVYVPLQEEAYALPGDQVPNVRPVGVLMQIDVSSAR